MATLPKVFDNVLVHAFIGQQVHAACSTIGYTTSARNARYGESISTHMNE
jgi:hypothetical protein